jgi:hypothetical protein
VMPSSAEWRNPCSPDIKDCSDLSDPLGRLDRSEFALSRLNWRQWVGCKPLELQTNKRNREAFTGSGR